MLKKFLFTSIIQLTVLPALHAQEKTFSPSQLLDDYKIFRSSLEEAHPGLYRYRNKSEMDKFFDASASGLGKPLTTLEFYNLLTPVISALGCGHTRVSLPDSWTQRHPIRKSRFPFDIRFITDKAIVIKNYSEDSDLAPGTELQAVDGTTVQNLKKKWLTLLNCDGFITTSRVKRIEQNFSTYVQFLIKEADSYSLVLRSSSGKTITKVVSLVPASTIPAPASRPQMEFKILDGEKTALLRIGTFGGSVSADGLDYQQFLERSFKALKEKGITNLIIDVRGNGGGRDDYGSLLYAYLTDKPFRYYHYLEMNKPTLSFIQYTDQGEGYKQSLEQKLVRQPDGRYLYKPEAHPCLPLQQAQPNHFDKKVFVLIDGASFSATAEFAAVTKFHKRATFIGEETGGAYEGNTSGGSVSVTLPNTGITYSIPLTKYVSAVDVGPNEKGRGVLPDIEIRQSYSGIVSGKDEALLAAQAEILK